MANAVETKQEPAKVYVTFASKLMKVKELRAMLAHANEYKHKDEYTHTALMLRMTPPSANLTDWP